VLGYRKTVDNPPDGVYHTFRRLMAGTTDNYCYWLRSGDGWVACGHYPVGTAPLVSVTLDDNP